MFTHVSKRAACAQNIHLFNVKRDGGLLNVRGFSNAVITVYMHVGLPSSFGENRLDLDGVVKTPSFG